MRLLLIMAALIPFAYLQEPARQVQQDGTGVVDRLRERRSGTDPIAIAKGPPAKRKNLPLNKPNKPKPITPPTHRPLKSNNRLLYSAADGYYNEMFN
ncbi:hypothetical protein PGT21_035811 [Puccinia graminis f. sp. tritici]|uniref:Uncharacterized protein n=1 Tax=Puccinia graminis f. sp. tritici TaxID=56615 RepID=A0A5B0P0R4_PUCGR|nr:hypothetical protein PGT21_035811 [Puccinia graminis f. sp. tritici]KAA1121390.1 hypothetical protein PGTUg99_019475 [Puccinia graminis f. sp. tritici]